MRRFALLTIALFLSVLPGAFRLEATAPEPFWDVPAHYVHEEAISYWQDAGYLKGFADGSFKPEALVTRAEALSMILRVNEISTENLDLSFNFTDVNSTDWFASTVQAALNENLITENEEALFRPGENITLAETLKISLGAAQIELASSTGEWYQAYLDYASSHNIITPNQDGSYNIAGFVSRGELAEILYRIQNDAIYTGETEYGTASFYSYKLNGVGTASGIPLYTYGHMAAHKTLPFGTKVKVTNLDNNLSTVVTIVDRGPYVEGRILDITPAAFEEIGKLSTGLLRVRMEVLKSEG